MLNTVEVIQLQVHLPHLKLQTVTSACNLVQVISQSTRVVTNSTGMNSSTCIDHICTNAAEICLKTVSRSIGCSDHNIVAISRKTEVPKAGFNIGHTISFVLIYMLMV